MSTLLFPDTALLDDLRAIEQKFIVSVNDLNAPLLKEYRDFVGSDAPEDITTRNLDAILRIHRASLAGASSEALYEIFARLVWPLHDELEQRAAVVEKASFAKKEEMEHATEQVVSLRKARIATGRVLPGDERLNTLSEAVEAMSARAQAELKKITDRGHLLRKIKSAVRNIRRARFIWRMIEVMAIVAGGFGVEKINEWIKDQVFELSGSNLARHLALTSIVGAAIWLVAAALMIWFHDEVVNEWMKRKIDRRRQNQLVSDMRGYFSHRMSLEYNLALLEHHVGVVTQVRADPGATGSSEPFKPTG